MDLVSLAHCAQRCHHPLHRRDEAKDLEEDRGEAVLVLVRCAHGAEVDAGKASDDARLAGQAALALLQHAARDGRRIGVPFDRDDRCLALHGHLREERGGAAANLEPRALRRRGFGMLDGLEEELVARDVLVHRSVSLATVIRADRLRGGTAVISATSDIRCLALLAQAKQVAHERGGVWEAHGSIRRMPGVGHRRRVAGPSPLVGPNKSVGHFVVGSLCAFVVFSAEVLVRALDGREPSVQADD